VLHTLPSSSSSISPLCNTWWRVNLWNSSLSSFPPPPSTSSLLSPNIPLSILFSDSPSPCSSHETKAKIHIRINLEPHFSSVCFSHVFFYIVAYRPVTKQWLDKQWPLLGNACNTRKRRYKNGVFYVISTATIAEQRRGKHTSTIEALCFLRDPCRGEVSAGSWRISTVRSRC
jgi:hypothetical protein